MLSRALGIAIFFAVGCAGGDGINGSPGKSGAEGSVGKQGPQGEPGEQGAPGDAGEPGATGAMGERGADGEDGARGPRGEQGPAGADAWYYPVGWIACDVAADYVDATQDVTTAAVIGTDGITETALRYTLTLFSNRDVSLQCESDLGSRESAAASAYYPGATNGAANASCKTANDYPPSPSAGATVGQWQFKLDANGPLATYVDPDPGHPLDGEVYRFTDADCTVLKTFGSEGMWQETTLAKLFP